jgi:hypothetical protein
MVQDLFPPRLQHLASDDALDAVIMPEFHPGMENEHARRQPALAGLRVGQQLPSRFDPSEKGYCFVSNSRKT